MTQSRPKRRSVIVLNGRRKHRIIITKDVDLIFSARFAINPSNQNTIELPLGNSG